MGKRPGRMPLPADLADQEKLLGLLERYGRDARRLRDLYYQMLCYCWRNQSDGFVPAKDIGGLVYPDPPRIGDLDMTRLIESELAEKGVGGYRLPDYQTWFPSSDAVAVVAGKQSEGARRANHDRWHVKRDMPEPDCPFCQSTDQYTDPSTGQSTDQSADQYTDQSTDRGTDSVLTQSTDPGLIGADDAMLFKGVTPPIVPPRAQPAEAGDDPHFTEFWEAYPRKVGKPRARKAWLAAMRRRHDPALIIKAAVAYRDIPGRQPQYTAHPATWLNDERYNDAPDATIPGPGERPPAGYSTSPWEN